LDFLVAVAAQEEESGERARDAKGAGDARGGHVNVESDVAGVAPAVQENHENAAAVSVHQNVAVVANVSAGTLDEGEQTIKKESHIFSIFLYKCLVDLI
jgi:hypothetical protein